MNEKRQSAIRLTLAVALALVLQAALTGCGKIEGPGYSPPAPPPPPSVPGVPPPPPNPPVGVVNDTEGFYVRHRRPDGDKYTYVSHRGDTSMGTACTAATGELVDCYIEAKELDLYFHGVDIQYNVPSTMCTYLRVRPYWYITRPIGPVTASQPPTTVHVDTDKNGDVGYDSNDDGVIDTTSETCNFDYTANDGPNCCVGKYTQISRAWDASKNAYGPATVGKGDWGGKIGNCVAGPAVDTQALNKYGIPVNSLYFVEGTGINNTYTVSAPIKKDRNQNVYVANYWNPADYASTSNVPRGLTAASTSVGTVTPVPYYDFQCLDAAEEFISQIRLYVRQWTRKSNFDAMATAPTLFQVSGAEPAPWNLSADYWDRGNWSTYTGTGYTYGAE